MTENLDLSMYQVRSDLAIEANEMATATLPENQTAIDGVETYIEENDGIKVTTVTVLKQGEKAIGKKPGLYVTVEAQGVRESNTEAQRQVEKAFTAQVEKMLTQMNVERDASCLIVGLGNLQVTPDALGPRVAESVMVTSHLFRLQPDSVAEGYRSVSAISPGVMGTTGLETSDIIRGVVEKTSPGFLVIVDALASRSIERVNATIQLTDTGIHPGSGVGNHRKEISRETMGIPVLSVGVPTVVDAVSITSDTIDFVLRHFGKELRDAGRPSQALAPSGMNFTGKKKLRESDAPSEENKQLFLGVVGTLEENEKRQLIHEVLSPIGHNLMVTPKDVDRFIEDMANLIATGLNAALHEAVNSDNAGGYMH